MQAGVDGLLRDKTRPSRVPPLSPEVAERVVARTTTDDPRGEATHWTASAMAKAVAISVSSVQRIWRTQGLQPHRVRRFKLSTDPQFAAKLRDIVGLYVDPPAHAAEARPRRDDDPRLYAQRHDDAARGAERAGGHGGRPLHAAPPAPGVRPLPQRHRRRRPGWPAKASKAAPNYNFLCLPQMGVTFWSVRMLSFKIII